MALAAPAAGAARDAERLLRVIEPTQGQGVFPSGQPVRVAVRRGAGLRVRVGGRDVTGRVHLRRVERRPNGRIVAGLLPRRLLRGRPKDVTFAARAGSRTDGDTVLLQAVRRHPGFLRLRLRRDSGRAPVEAVIRTRRHRVWLRATLNGRRIEDRAISTGLGVRRLRLTRTEGLRPGRNVLRVAANGRGGRGDIERKIFRLNRRAVIPGVRAPDSVRVGNVVRLDAGPSYARRSRLNHRWRIVDRPKGSQAKLLGARRRVARLRVDRPGHYSVQLTASRKRSGKRRGEGGRRIARASSSGSLVTDVTAQAPISPYGIPLTLDPSQGIGLGGSTIHLATSTGSILLAAIDSATGAVKGTSQVRGTGTRDIEDFIGALGDYGDPNTIVMILGDASGETSWCTISGIENLASNLGGLGIDNDDLGEAAESLVCGEPFAYVGTPGSISGSATINTASGRLSGRLRLTGLSKSLTGTLVFEQPDYRLFRFGAANGQTRVTGINPAAGATPSNAIDQAMSAADGMQVTILDAYDLSTVAAAGGSSGGENGAITPVRNLLEEYVGDDDKLVLFKMDAITAWENTRVDMAAILKALTSIGANRDAFIRSLSFPDRGYGGNQYIFFGGLGVAPVEGTDAITAETPNGGQLEVSSPTLTGMLRRNHRARWEPVATRTDDKIEQPMQALATRAPVAYSYPSSPSGTEAQYRAAERKLFGLLTAAGVLCTPGPSCGVPVGVRVNYANQELLDNLGKASSALKCSGGSVPADSGAHHTQAQLDALRTDVCGELSKLELVHGKLFGVLLNQVFPKLASDSTLDLLSGSDTYLGFLEDKRDRKLAGRNKFLGISGAAAEVLGDMFSGATAIADYVLAPETGGASIFGGTVIGDALMLGGDSLGLASNASGVGESSDKVAPSLITVGNLFTYIQSSFGYTTARTAETEALITSDPTKLSDAAAKVTDGSWDLEQQINFEHQTYQAIIFQQRVSALRYMLPRMLSADAKACDTGGSADDPTTYLAWTKLQEIGPGGNYLKPDENRLRSVHIDSSDAQVLGPRLFSAPFTPGTDPIAAGPSGAAIAPSPFFLREVADTTDSGKGDCTENFSL